MSFIVRRKHPFRHYLPFFCGYVVAVFRDMPPLEWWRIFRAHSVAMMGVRACKFLEKEDADAKIHPGD